MTTPTYFVVSLWIRDGRAAEFEAYERKAARLMKRFGGSLERAVRIEGGNTAERPFEVHLVRFPSRAMFDAYRADPQTAALASEREAVIARTVIHAGRPRAAPGRIPTRGRPPAPAR
jgi:uncharacterized protein (DUF1330 family)